MPRSAKYNPEVIGPELVRHRDHTRPRTPWKTLERIYGLGRCRLHQLYRDAKSADHKDVYKHPQSGQVPRILGYLGVMGSSPPKPDPPPPPPPPPTPEDPAVDEARRQALLARQAARGRAATVLTGARGVTTPGQTAVKRLLGE